MVVSEQGHKITDVSELPQGTVTFAFTDIEGSTALLKRLGDGYGEVLSDHRRLVRETFTKSGGVEIDTQGDAFFFAFARAREAVEAAAEVQRAHASHDWAQDAEVRMRIGLHTGEPSVGEEGYLGIDVVRAARLCSTCVGGQVLLSETTRALLGSSLPSGVSVFPLGERHLKDLDQPELVYELEIEGLPRPPTGGGEIEKPKRVKRPWEEDLEQRIESFTERAISGVMDRVERGFGGSRKRDDSPAEDDVGGGLDEMAGHADDLAGRIKKAIRALGPDR
jgi:class 3 adenylate cyclase